MRNCTVGQVAGAVLDIDLFYEEGEGGGVYAAGKETS